MGDFLYYPDLDDPALEPKLYRKQEFYETKNSAREFYKDKTNRKALIKKICNPDVRRLQNHQIFLRNYISPETPYSGILVFHGLGTGKCVLPDTKILLNSEYQTIEQIWQQYHSDIKLDPDLPTASWSSPKKTLSVFSLSQKNKDQPKLISAPISQLYRQRILEKIKIVTLENNREIKITLAHHLLTPTGWTNNFSTGDKIAVPDFENQSQKFVCIKSIHHQFYQGYVYDLEILKYHNYVANGIICHNTCAAVTVAEGLKSMVEKYDKKIYVLSNEALAYNFQKTLYNIEDEKRSKFPGAMQCTGTTYFREPQPQETIEEKIRRDRKIKKDQSKFYVYMGYNKFSNFVNKKIAPYFDLDEYFSNSVFIIDESQNLVSKARKMAEESRKARQALRKIFKTAKNTKLVLLSATPMINEINDIIVLINLLRANDNRRSNYTALDLGGHDHNSLLTAETLDVPAFKEFSRGYISYYRGGHPSSFPMTLHQNEYHRRPKYDIFGLPLKTKIVELKNLNLVECEMSPFQFYHHYRYLLLYNKNSKKILDRKTGRAVPRYPIDSRDITKTQSSNIIFPVKGSNLQGLALTRDNKLEDIFRKRSERGLDRYSYLGSQEFLDIDQIGRFSCKFERLFRDLMENIGVNFIYNYYRESGVVPICLMLEQNGYVRYHPELKLEYHGKYTNTKDYLVQKVRTYRCVCGYLDSEHPARAQDLSNYRNLKEHKFLQGTYLRVDGETISEFEAHSKKVTSPDNVWGEIIKVIVGGRNTNEGIDLKFIRSVHIMNPWHNLIQIEQAIGRGVRFCSHGRLPVEEMYVKIYKYISIPSQKKIPKTNEFSITKIPQREKDELIVNDPRIVDLLKTITDYSDWLSSDEQVYARALNKDFNIKFAERLLKEASIDCSLNIDANTNWPQDTQNDFTRECDYQKCNYTCDHPPTKKKLTAKDVNYDTYDLYFVEPKIKEAQFIVTELFSQNWALTLNSIVQLVQEAEPELEKDIIFMALDKMVGKPPRYPPIPVLDSLSRYGHLIFQPPFYLFQPNEISDPDIPLYYRKRPQQSPTTIIDLRDALKPVIPKTRLSLKKGTKTTSLTSKLAQISEPGSQLGEPLGELEVKLQTLQGASYQEITLTLNHLELSKHLPLINQMVEKWEMSDGDRLTEFILGYYMDNYLLAHTNMKYDRQGLIAGIPDPGRGQWVHDIRKGKYLSYQTKTNKWQEVDESDEVIIQIASRAPTLTSIQDIPRTDLFYGFVNNDNNNKEMKFKVADIVNQLTKTKKNSQTISLKTLNQGKVCMNYSSDQVQFFCEELDIPYSRANQKSRLCSLIEEKLYERDQQDQKQKWYFNFFEYQRSEILMKNKGRIPTNLNSLYFLYLR